eukprot:sb/3470095/
MLLDQLNEAVQLLLAHSGLVKSLSRGSLAARKKLARQPHKLVVWVHTLIVHAANQHYTNCLSVVEYMKRTGLANKDSLRLQAVCYAHLGRFNSAAEVYRELFGGRVSVSVLITDKTTGRDLYNYCFVLVRLRHFGSAYDIAKILANSAAGGGVVSTKCCRLLVYLRIPRGASHLPAKRKNGYNSSTKSPIDLKFCMPTNLVVFYHMVSKSKL